MSHTFETKIKDSQCIPNRLQSPGYLNLSSYQWKAIGLQNKGSKQHFQKIAAIKYDDYVV
jgi:hypothetical protein